MNFGEMISTIIEAIAQDYPNPREMIFDVIGTGLSGDMELEEKFMEMPRTDKDLLIDSSLKQYGF